MLKALITAGTLRPSVITEVVLATLQDHPALKEIFILDTPTTRQASHEAASNLKRQNALSINFFNLPSPDERPEVIRESLTDFFDSVLSNADKGEIVIDLTAGTKAISQLLYIVASTFGIEHFQVFARRHFGRETRPFESLVKGKIMNCRHCLQ